MIRLSQQYRNGGESLQYPGNSSGYDQVFRSGDYCQIREGTSVSQATEKARKVSRLSACRRIIGCDSPKDKCQASGRVQRHDHALDSFWRNERSRVVPLFLEFSRVTEATEEINPEYLAKIMGEMDLSGEMVSLSDNMREAMKTQAEWMQFLMNHTEGGVPMDDPSGWTETKVREYLKKHGLSIPTNTPNANEILVPVARHMIDFCHCCLVLLDNSLPDDEHAEALGRRSMGEATERDHQLIAQREAPVQRLEVILEAQIPAFTKLSKLSKWTGGGNTLQVFETTRLYHKMNYKIRSLHEMLEQLDEIAVAFDWVATGEHSDVLVMFSADEGNSEEQSLAVRALEAREMDGVPVLSIQWVSATKKGNGPDTVNKLARGFVQGKTVFHNHQISSVAMDLLVSLIAANRDNLDSTDDVFKAFERQLPLGWKFSVLRPVDPSKKGGVMNCPGCGKTAKKLCGKCKNVSYCSRDCQVSCWKKHKPNCKAPS
jgi:hypothetical protein